METFVITLGFVVTLTGIIFLLNAFINTAHHYFHKAMYLRDIRILNQQMMKEIEKIAKGYI